MVRNWSCGHENQGSRRRKQTFRRFDSILQKNIECYLEQIASNEASDFDSKDLEWLKSQGMCTTNQLSGLAMLTFPDNEVNFTTRFHDVSVQVSDIV